MPRERKVIGSVQRAIDILDLFSIQTPELGTTEIARGMSLPKSTVAGLVSTLEQNGYLDQNPENRKYRLGFKLAERTGVFLELLDLRRIAAPTLEDLRDDCNESVNLAVRDEAYVVYIERMHGTSALGMRSEIGKRERIHSTALGKAILAYLPAEEMRRFVFQYPFEPVTPHTITNPAMFLEELNKTRQRGFALDDEENELGGRCVAAPIIDYLRKPIAALSISVPLQRLPEEKIDALGAKVLQAARQISQKIGASRALEAPDGNHL
jgi:IclR family KDG regulon transcriptional repressor